MATGRTLDMYTCGERASVPRQLADAGSLTQIIIFLAVRDTLKSCTDMLKPIIAEFTKSLYLWVMLVTSEKGMTSTECLSKVSTDRGQAGKDCNVLKHRCN